MFKQMRFLVETNIDFLFKKSQEICQCEYVHLEFFDRPTNTENETHVSYDQTLEIFNKTDAFHLKSLVC